MTMRWDLIGLGVAALVLIFAIASRPQNENLLRFDVQGDRAFGYGYTDGRSEGVVRKLLKDHPQVDTLVFVDMPGTQDVTSNYRLARTIRQLGLNTELLPYSRIASGAVDLFAAGVSRRAACGAKVGVHAWGTSGFDAQDALWDNHRSYSRRFLSDMGLPPDFYDFRTEAAPSAGIHWMSAAEMERWQLVTEPMHCKS